MRLLERLSPDHQQMLKDAEIEYPYSAKKLQEELNEVNHWCDLKYSTIVNLTIYLRTGDYSPSAIDKLFSHEEH
jgi:hypothetical protein